MDKQIYKECYAVSQKHNDFLEQYSQHYVEDKVTREEENEYQNIGFRYAESRDWYYQYDKETNHWYVVVDYEEDEA